MSRSWQLMCTSLLIVACGGEDINRAALDEALSRARPDGKPRVTRGGRTVPFVSLPPHIATLRMQFTLGSGTNTRDRATVTRLISRGSGGKFALDESRTWSNPNIAAKGVDHGREAIFDGQRFVSRRRWGPWKERSFWRGDQLELLTACYDLFPAILAAFKPYITWMPPTKTTILGKPAQRWVATFNTTPVLKKLSASQLKALRSNQDKWAEWMAQTHRPDELRVEVVRLVGSTDVIEGRVTVRGTAQVDGHTKPFGVKLQMSVKRLTNTRPFRMPKKVLPQGRERTWAMIKNVLGEALNPIYERTRTAPKKR